MSRLSDVSYKLEFSPDFSSKLITFIYGLIFVCNLLINIDHGSIPAATLNLKQDLNIDNVELGILGSLVYLGLTAGMWFVRHHYYLKFTFWFINFISCRFINSDTHLQLHQRKDYSDSEFYFQCSVAYNVCKFRRSLDTIPVPISGWFLLSKQIHYLFTFTRSLYAFTFQCGLIPSANPTKRQCGLLCCYLPHLLEWFLVMP